MVGLRGQEKDVIDDIDIELLQEPRNKTQFGFGGAPSNQQVEEHQFGQEDDQSDSETVSKRFSSQGISSRDGQSDLREPMVANRATIIPEGNESDGESEEKDFPESEESRFNFIDDPKPNFEAHGATGGGDEFQAAQNGQSGQNQTGAQVNGS